MWLQRRGRGEGGEWWSSIGVELLARADICLLPYYRSCSQRLISRCLSRPGFSKRSSFHPPTPANHSAASSSTPKGPVLTTDYKTFSFARPRLPFSSFQIHASYNKTLLNGRFTLLCLVYLFSRCAERNLAFVRNRGWAPNLDYARLEFTDRSGISMVYIST